MLLSQLMCLINLLFLAFLSQEEQSEYHSAVITMFPKLLLCQDHLFQSLE